MKRKRSFLRTPLLIGGAAVLGYAGVRALLDLRPGADVDFFRWTGPTAKGIDVGSVKVDLPILYYRDDSFMGVFTAAREPVRALLPSRQLYPVLASAERAMLVVIAFNYFETSVGPYGEIGIVIHARMAASRRPGCRLRWRPSILAGAALCCICRSPRAFATSRNRGREFCAAIVERKENFVRHMKSRRHGSG